MKKFLELANGIVEKIPNPYTKVLSSILKVGKIFLDNEELSKNIKNGVNNFIDENITHKTEVKNISLENQKLKEKNDELEAMVKKNWNGLKEYNTQDDYIKEELRIAQSLDAFFEQQSNSQSNTKTENSIKMI